MFAITPPGGAEWIIIGFIFVLLFGARKLPELGGSVGKSIRNFKKGVSEANEDEGPDGAGPSHPSAADSQERTPSGSTPES